MYHFLNVLFDVRSTVADPAAKPRSIVGDTCTIDANFWSDTSTKQQSVTVTADVSLSLQLRSRCVRKEQRAQPPLANAGAMNNVVTSSFFSLSVVPDPGTNTDTVPSRNNEDLRLSLTSSGKHSPTLNFALRDVTLILHDTMDAL